MVQTQHQTPMTVLSFSTRFSNQNFESCNVSFPDNKSFAPPSPNMQFIDITKEDVYSTMASLDITKAIWALMEFFPEF